MKKKILSGIFALALLATTGYGVNRGMKSNADLSDITLANVETLAQTEIGDCTVIGYTHVWSGGCLYYCARCSDGRLIALSIIECVAR